MKGDFSLRKAKLGDAEKIFALIHLNRDQLVPRAMGNIIENIDRFVVAEIGEAEAATAEIQSVAVRSPYRRKGIGRALVEAVLKRLAEFGPRDAIVLTFAPDFFTSLGFREIPKTKVMHKLYTGCINCTKHANPFTCPEIAMIRELGRN